MNFASTDYAVFLCFTYLVFRFVLKGSQARQILLLFASLLFYTWGSGWHLSLLLYSGLCDFYLAKAISHASAKQLKKVWLWFSMLNNIGLLFLFKYLDAVFAFLNNTILPETLTLPQTHWLLPIGISFYTFQTMSYSLDVYFGRLKPCKGMLEYLLYVTFFPQLVAGPILRANHFIPQIKKVFSFQDDLFFKGLFLILLGLLKKVWIADTLGLSWVDPVYANPENYSHTDILLATYAYALQLFNDFSGYSDIAIGSALIFGFIVPPNFDSPYRCSNPGDFWNRWHISLSYWVRDYIFYPLMMKGKLKGCVKINSFLTILIIGIWHGANLTFVLFGLHHGIIAVLHRKGLPWLSQWKAKYPKAYPILAWFIYWHLICFGALLFRADSLGHIVELLNVHETTLGLNLQHLNLGILIVFGCAIISHWPRATQWDQCGLYFAKAPLSLKVLFTWCVLCLLLWCEHTNQGRAAFIYFRF